MQGAKKVVVVVALLAVVAVTIWLTVERVTARPQPPAWFREKVDEKIDRKTLKKISLTNEQWHRLEAGDRLWKNPETGEATVTDIMVCASCGEDIPWPELSPDDPNADKPGAIFGVLAQYMCPKCGQHAWGGPGLRARPRAPAGTTPGTTPEAAPGATPGAAP